MSVVLVEDSLLREQVTYLMRDYPDRSQSNAADPLLVCKLFDIAGSASWYLTEYDPDEEIGFSYVTGMDYDEWGSVSIAELAALRLSFERGETTGNTTRVHPRTFTGDRQSGGIPRIEVDKWFKPMRFSELKAKKRASEDEEATVPDGWTPVDDLPHASEVINDRKVDMPLPDFLSQFGGTLLDQVREQNPPIFDPSKPDPLVNQVLSSLSRKAFPKQAEAVQAIIANMFGVDEPATILNAEMGTGKTMMAIATAAVAHAKGLHRALVIAPPHLVYKWRREIKTTIPNARVWILNGPDTLRKLLEIRQMREAPKVPEFFILGRVRMRMGFNWRPVFTSKMVLAEQGETRIRAEVAHCADCFKPITVPTGEDGGERPLLAEEAGLKLNDKRMRCVHCDSPLWTLMHKDGEAIDRRELVHSALNKIPTIGPKTASKLLDKFGEDVLGEMLSDNVYEFVNLMDEDGELVFSDKAARRIERSMATLEFAWGQGGYQPTEFIKRYLPQGYFGLLIADEGHEYKNEGSAQGQAMGVLARKCTKSLLLTGTLMGGYADDLFYLLWRLNPARMIADGFYYNERGSLGSASLQFLRLHGVVKDIYTEKAVESRSHRTARGTQTVHRTAKGPGFGPKGIMRYILPITVFLKLKDLGEGVLPAYKEYFVPINMTEDQRSAYVTGMQFPLKEALSKALRAGDRSLMGVVLNALLAWPDCCFRPETVVHPHHRNRVLASVGAIFSEGELSPKEEELLTRCKAEKAEGRRVLVYTTYTGTRDTAQRLKQQLEAAGLKTAVLRSSVEAAKREDWVMDQVDRGIDVLLCNPELVKTGLDLLEFPTIVFMQSGYNVYTLMQAARRSWRIGQINDVRVYFFGYANSAQMSCLELMSSKIMVTQSTSGDMPESGLDILNQSDEGIEMQLAKQLLAA